MPTIIDKATGEVREVIDYNSPDIDLQVEQALLKHPDSVVSNDAMYRSNTTWEDGNTVQNPSENVPDPYGAYNPMGDLTKKV